jgi:hypothetical protein
MKVLVKYVGFGMMSRGYQFSPLVNDGLYEVEKEDADYFLKTFPDHFILIEPKVEETKKKAAPKKKAEPKKSEPKVEAKEETTPAKKRGRPKKAAPAEKE